MTVKIEHQHDKIRLYITNSKSEKYVGYTDYDENLFEIISASSWHVKKSHYIYSSKYKKYLHQLIVDYWYGEECRRAMQDNGFVIDHLDNNGFNCQYENLEFLNGRKNLHLKGNVFDKVQKEQIPLAALSIYKRHDKTFQITVGFNKPVYNSKGEEIVKLCLSYNNRDYDFVLNDALLLQDFIKKEAISFKDLRNDDLKWDTARKVISKTPLKPGSVINGHIVMGEGVQIIKIAPNKDLN